MAMITKDFITLEPRFKDTADANKFLDQIKEQVGAYSDAQMARAIDVKPPMICKIRKGHLSVSNGLIITIHEATKIEIAQLKAMAGMKQFHEQ
jgi:hypothetical protein